MLLREMVLRDLLLRAILLLLKVGVLPIKFYFLWSQAYVATDLLKQVCCTNFIFLLIILFYQLSIFLYTCQHKKKFQWATDLRATDLQKQEYYLFITFLSENSPTLYVVQRKFFVKIWALLLLSVSRNIARFYIMLVQLVILICRRYYTMKICSGQYSYSPTLHYTTLLNKQKKVNTVAIK